MFSHCKKSPVFINVGRGGTFCSNIGVALRFCESLVARILLLYFIFCGVTNL